VGDKYDEVMRRNRLRIAGLAAAGLLNYWLAVLLFIAAVTVGALGALIVRGLLEGGDFSLAWDLVQGIPDAFRWVVAAGWLSSATMAWAALAFVAIGTLTAIGMMWGRLRKLEASVPRTGAADRSVAGVLEGVAIAAGVPAPSVVVIEESALNSCSVGRKPGNATIVVTRGLVAGVTRDELEAVLAYELSRVSSLDTALSTWTAAVTGRTIEIAEGSERILVQLALALPVRRARRLRARTLKRQAAQRDILALGFTRHPEALLSALAKIAVDTTSVTSASTATAPLWLEWPWPETKDPQGAPALGGRIEELRALVVATG
jgi:heat shock protein HtpX